MKKDEIAHAITNPKEETWDFIVDVKVDGQDILNWSHQGLVHFDIDQNSTELGLELAAIIKKALYNNKHVFVHITTA